MECMILQCPQQHDWERAAEQEENTGWETPLESAELPQSSWNAGELLSSQRDSHAGGAAGSLWKFYLWERPQNFPATS